MGEMISAPQHSTQQHGTAFMHKTQCRFRGSNIDDGHIARNLSPFFFEKLTDRKQGHAVDSDRGGIQVSGSHKLQMLSNFRFRSRSDKHVGFFGL